MKKLVLVLALLLVMGGFVCAQDDPVRIDASSGIYYDAYPFQTEGGFQIFESLFNLRAGVHLGLGFNLSEFMTLGAEAGALAMYWSYSDGSTVVLMDLPFHGYVDFRLGEALGLKVYGGGIGIGVLANGIAFGIRPEAGARLMLGGFYLEAAYVFGVSSDIWRYGLGFSTNLLAEDA